MHFISHRWIYSCSAFSTVGSLTPKMDGSSATPPATAVLEVTQETASALFRTLACALPRAAAVAVDCELTGLGAAVGRKAASQSPQQRYTTLRHVAATRALLSIGICCLERLPPPPPSSSSAGGGAESKPNTDVAGKDARTKKKKKLTVAAKDRGKEKEIRTERKTNRNSERHDK